MDYLAFAKTKRLFKKALVSLGVKSSPRWVCLPKKYPG